MTKRQSITENITEESRKVKMNIEEEIDFEGEADKLSLSSTRFSRNTTKIE